MADHQFRGNHLRTTGTPASANGANPPCPTCGSRRIIFKPLTVAYNPLYHEIYRSWFCGCKDCAPRGKIRGFHIITPHKDLKEAIRAWNHIANNHPKAKGNAK